MASSVTVVQGHAPIPSFGGLGREQRRIASYGYTCGSSALSMCLPSDMLAAARDLDSQIRAVMADVDANRGRISSTTGAGWDAFVKSWESFTEQNKGPGEGWLYGTGAGDWFGASAIPMSAINSYLSQLIDWRGVVSRQIGGLSSPDPSAPEKGPVDQILNSLPWIAGGLLVLYFAPAIVRAWRK